MKIAFKFILTLSLALVSVVATIFYRPDVLVNEKAINFILERLSPIKYHSWKKFKFNHEYVNWNRRRLSGEISEFCIKAELEAAKIDTCFEVIEFDLLVQWRGDEGISLDNDSYIRVISKSSKVVLLAKEDTSKKPDSEPINLYEYYQLGWSSLIPKISLDLENIAVKQQANSYSFNILVEKTNAKALVKFNELELEATKQMARLSLPTTYQLPNLSNDFLQPLKVDTAQIQAIVGKEFVEISANAKLADVKLNASTQIKSKIIPSQALEQLLGNLNGAILIADVKKSLKLALKEPFNELPAPFNEMSGSVRLNLKGNTSASDIPIIQADLLVDFSSKQQQLDFNLKSYAGFDLAKKNIKMVNVNLDVKQISLFLPRLPKRSLPPQLLPDGRIVENEIKFKNKLAQKQEEIEDPFPLDVNITAKGEDVLIIHTNLLDSPIRLNVDAKIEKSNMKSAFIKVLPFETEIFKRQIKLNLLEITKEGEDGYINALVEFVLPEYNVFLKLEGPLSSPRYALSSRPALSQGDIISVLLFGRPLEGVDPGDQEAVARTNELISQGVLSLSVLYFLSGSPIQAITYDPNSKQVGAQIGLSRKSSLNVGGSSGGVNTVGVRYSLGGGWFIDTSARESEEIEKELGTDYGVMLERILAY